MCGLLFRLSVVLLEKAFLEYCYGCFSSYLIAEYAFILLSNHRCNAFKCFCVTTYFNSLHFSEPVSYIVTDSCLGGPLGTVKIYQPDSLQVLANKSMHPRIFGGDASMLELVRIRITGTGSRKR